MMVYARIGRNVRAYRIAQGLTQARLAERAQLSVACISKIERGVENFKIDTLESISVALDIDVSVLMEAVEPVEVDLMPIHMEYWDLIIALEQISPNKKRAMQLILQLLFRLLGDSAAEPAKEHENSVP